MHRFNSFWGFTFSILIIFAFVFVPFSPALAGGGDFFDTLITVAIVAVTVYAITVGVPVPIEAGSVSSVLEAGGSVFYSGVGSELGLAVGQQSLAGGLLEAAGYTGFYTTASVSPFLAFGATAGALLAGSDSPYQQAPVIDGGTCYGPVNSCGQSYQGTWSVNEGRSTVTRDEDGNTVNIVRRDEDGNIIPAASPQGTCSAPSFAPPESGCPARTTTPASPGTSTLPGSSQNTSGVSCQNQVYASPGSYQFTVPEGISSIQARVVGGGGGGGGSYMDGDAHGGQGGGSGGYLYDTISVSPGQSLNISVGNGGCGGHYWYFGNDNGGSCPYLTWAGVDGAGSSIGALVATGGRGGAAAIIGGNTGAGGSPNGGNGVSGTTFSCSGGVGGSNGSGNGAGGKGGSCAGGLSGENGYVKIEWACTAGNNLNTANPNETGGTNTTPGATNTAPTCVRDGVCSSNETASSCPSDCADIPVTISDPNPNKTNGLTPISGGFVAVPPQVLYNGTTTLSWNATGATTCTIVGTGISGKETDRYVVGITGSKESSRLLEDTNFTLSCSNNRRGFDSKTILVKVINPKFQEF